MNYKEIQKLERIAENSDSDTESKSSMIILRSINATYHWCPDWDYAVICDKSNEWECCTCDIKLKQQ